MDRDDNRRRGPRQNVPRGGGGQGQGPRRPQQARGAHRPQQARGAHRPQQNDGRVGPARRPQQNDDNDENGHEGRQQNDGWRDDDGRRQQNFRRGAGRPANQNRRNTNHVDDDNDARVNDRNSRAMGFRLLQEIADTDGPDVLLKLSQTSKLFGNLINSKIDKQDLIVLVVKVVGKVCASSFEQLKVNMLLELCNSEFISTLKNYLMELPYVPAHEKRQNNVYWGNPTAFWADFVCFCESIILRSPSTAMKKCRALIDGTSRACLDGLKERHHFRLPKEDDLKLAQLRDQLLICEKEEEKKVERYTRHAPDEAADPPEDFRQLSVLPTRQDLINERPFLRPNLVRGRYASVEHYLDVQFRLLREDCVGPLRDGLLQYIKDPRKKKYDNIRVFAGVKLVDTFVAQNKVGMMVKFDEKTAKRHKKINWAHNKRLLYGSLLLFTKNNFHDIIVATVLDRDEKIISQGKLAVAFVNMANEMQSLYNCDTYIMVESEVYFEPYFHVLTALQDPGFPNHIAMSKYIIHVDPVPHFPAYLTEDTKYTMQLMPGLPSGKVRVLDEDTWPTRLDLGLNESQYEAYKLALTHEFAVIQGPPGTGKTFLGVKVAKTLLDNIPKIRLLLICFTNHALDQFLEAILPVTKSMVRIGGQSRNDNLKEYNLMNLRRSRPDQQHSKLFYEQKHELKVAVSQLQSLQTVLDKVNNGVLAYNVVRGYAPEVQCLEQLYDRQRGDVLKQWLFDNLKHDAEPAEDEDDGEFEQFQVNAVDVDDDPNRMELLLDDDDGIIEPDPVSYNVSTSFNLNEAMVEVNRLKRRFGVSEASGNEEDMHFLEMAIQSLRACIKRFRDMSILMQDKSTLKTTNRRNPRQFPIADRWKIYFGLAKIQIDKIIENMKPLQLAQETANTAYEEARMIMDLSVLRKAKVIGMTTSGAARLRKQLQSLAPNIVIVEEAAEVLECHIVTALTRSCQHLILIGDHQQLRPSAASYRLAQEYNMEVSLFERMIANGIHSRRLSVQHRMRPEIAALITPSIYRDLADHESVMAFPQVRGLENSLHFLSHDFKETALEESASKSNQREADLALGLANYLMQQGYEPEDVTLLAAYSGQMFYMRKQRPLYKFLAKVKMTVVDNYQGEESKIILLSLVRNNDANKIGFLGTVNRVCVALSRAREGFYIFGNMDILKQNAEIWTKIAATLEQNGSLSRSLRLKCENHPERITTIESATDFEKVPEGGCLLKCTFNLPCGHLCPLICHGYDRGHVAVGCPLKCERVLCELGHVCPAQCSEECGPCMILVEKALPCKHRMRVHCHLEPADPTIKCRTIVDVTLSGCGHEAKKPCYMDKQLVACPVPCETRVEPCGHQCRLRCHVNDDPDHKHYACEKPCAKAKSGCRAELIGERGDHQCNKRCYEPCDDCNILVSKKRSDCKHTARVACRLDVDATPCRANCARALPCGHYCKKKCFEPCGDCRQKVKKTIEACGHEVMVACGAPAARELCTKPCERTLPCGHACRGPCARACDPARCKELVDLKFRAPCGHDVRLPCNLYRSYVDGEHAGDGEWLLQYCLAPCAKLLACEHPCAGSCGACRQGRLHAPCASVCQQTNICGHQCLEPCNQVCPPCKAPCEVKCPHTKCKKTCGNPCVPCQEECKRACPHGQCSRRCGEPCSRPPCAAACPLPRPCGHACRGLCGEPCPDICRLCRPDDFPRDFIGYDYDDDDKFVKLQDCPHVLDLDNLDCLMTADSETVSIRACPYCRKPIVNTYRYKDLINNMFQKQINPIKEKIYGTKKQIATKRGQLLFKARQFSTLHQTVIEASPHCNSAFNQFHNVVTRKQGPAAESLLQFEMYSIYLEMLETVALCHGEYATAAAKSRALADEFDEQMALVCTFMVGNIRKMSQQQQRDLSNETKRLHAIVQLAKVVSCEAYAASRATGPVETAAQAARRAILTWGVYAEVTALTALKRLEDAVKVTGVVTKQERDEVVKAIGLKAGHWFRCPNGHFYCIGECGGAMEESRCIECGAAVGGSRHRLREDNAHARELDGSRHAAWSDLANNMANFRLD